MLEQTIRLSPRITAFTVVCERCAEDAFAPEAWLAATIGGRLGLDASHGTVTCPRGHEIRVERTSHGRARTVAA
jgi:hypothetical protein